MEDGWICIDNKKCINLKDANGLKVLCGNGNTEGVEGCDDGNTLEGDGCSSECKVETGWDCKIYTQLGKKSYCRRIVNGNSYCGNGII